MKKIIKFSIAALATVAVSSCQTKPSDNDKIIPLLLKPQDGHRPISGVVC